MNPDKPVSDLCMIAVVEACNEAHVSVDQFYAGPADEDVKLARRLASYIMRNTLNKGYVAISDAIFPGPKDNKSTVHYTVTRTAKMIDPANGSDYNDRLAKMVEACSGRVRNRVREHLKSKNTLAFARSKHHSHSTRI